MLFFPSTFEFPSGRAAFRQMAGRLDTRGMPRRAPWTGAGAQGPPWRSIPGAIYRSAVQAWLTKQWTAYNGYTVFCKPYKREVGRAVRVRAGPANAGDVCTKRW